MKNLLPINQQTLQELTDTKNISETSIALTASIALERLGDLNPEQRIALGIRFKALKRLIELMETEIKGKLSKTDLEGLETLLSCKISYGATSTQYDYKSAPNWVKLKQDLSDYEDDL